MEETFQDESWLLEETDDQRDAHRRLRASKCGQIFASRAGRVNAGQPMVFATRCGVVEYCDYCMYKAVSDEKARAMRVLENDQEFYMTVLDSERAYLAFRKRVKRAGGEVRRYPVRDNAITCLFTVDDAVRDERYQTIADIGQIEWHCLCLLPPGRNKSGAFGKEEVEDVDVGPTMKIKKIRYTPRGLTRKQLIEAMNRATEDVMDMEVDLESQEEVQIFFEAVVHADMSRICELGGYIEKMQEQNCQVQILQLKSTLEAWKIRTDQAEKFIPERSRNVSMDDLLAAPDDLDLEYDIFDDE